MTMMGNGTAEGGAGAMRRAAIAIAVFLVLVGLLFQFGPDDFYPWAKAIHVIAVISWMAGMLYLPRLLVYHADAEKGSVQSETFKVMERRLLRGIINPAMIITWVFG
ncbi:MAG: TIGR00701 family protein, partial [Mesorhizobium sp.]